MCIASLSLEITVIYTLLIKLFNMLLFVESVF